MTMTDRPIYKRQERDRRRIIQDGNFRKGMYYTSNLVDASTSRLLMNYNIRDNGKYVTPRMGIRMNDVQDLGVKKREFFPTSRVPGVHTAFYGLYRDSDRLDKFGNIYLSFGIPSSHEYAYYDTNSKAIDSAFRDQVYTNIEDDAFGIIADENGDIYPVDMSDVKDTRLRFYKDTVKPLYTIFNNKLYTIDGSAGEQTGTERYVSSGEISREMRFPYPGTFTKLEVRPTRVDYEPFDIVTTDSTGVQLNTAYVSVPLLYLETSGVHNYYDGVSNTVHEKVKKFEFSDLYTEENVEVEDRNLTTFVKIPKPEDSLIKGSVSSDNFKSFLIEGSDELDMVEAEVLDHTNNIGKFSTRIDEDFIYYVTYKESSVEDALYDLGSTVVKYELLKENVHSMGSGNPLTIKENGKIIFNTPKGPFELQVMYTIAYNRPIYAYYGGIQEYSFNRVGEGFKASPDAVKAKQPKISEATSVGFNMLHANPYSFSNTEGIVLQPLGIMPYKPGSAQQISMSANIGEEIEFEVFYEYTKDAKYYVKWEYLPLSTGVLREPTLISETKTPIKAGGRVVQRIKANDAKFSLRVTMYPEKDGKKDEATAKVVLYPVYEAGNAYLKDISAHQYDLHNARGIGSYKTMLTLWGVPGAETTLFFSDIDDVSYFPFPNNILSFQHKVLGTHEYMGGLLVITTDSIYVVEGDMPEKFVATEIYQGLKFTKEDVESLKVIKNMIFIRSGNRYYVLLPNTYTGELTDVKIQNVSSPIKELTSDWEKFLRFLSDEVFGWDISWGKYTSVKEYDFFNYIADDDVIKNVYRFVVKDEEKERKRKMRYQIDIILNFHTDKGIWTLETMNLPFNEVVPYKNKLYSSYAVPYGDEVKHYIQELEFRNSTRRDFYNTSVYGEYFNDKSNSSLESELQQLPERVEDEVVRVIDGDTIVTKRFGSIRFHYVDAPEDTTISEEFGPEATQITKDFLPPGTQVTLEFEGERSDRYDRVLAWVFKGNKLAQLELAEKGGVKAIYSFGVKRYTDSIDRAIEKAMEEEIGFWETYTGDLEVIHTQQTEALVPNYQVLDTGNKNHDPYLTKRYREFQFQISNKSEDNLYWYNRFYIDARPMQDFRKYELYHETDERSADYGTVTVIPTDTMNMTTKAPTYLNTWRLDENMFPDLDIVRVRFRVSGKGTFPRLLMISKNEAHYDLIGYSWVMRQMNFR